MSSRDIEMPTSPENPADYGEKWLSLMCSSAHKVYLLERFRKLPNANNEEVEEAQKTRDKLKRINSALYQLKDSWIEINFPQSDREPVEGLYQGLDPGDMTCFVKPINDKLQAVTFGILVANPIIELSCVEPIIALSSHKQFEY